MASRLDLHAELVKLCGSGNVYFQSPENIQMKYPAIRYSRSDIKNTFANDNVYTQNHMYNVVVIDEDPDSEIVYKVSKMKSCKFDRHYIADGLNHDSFTLQY